MRHCIIAGPRSGSTWLEFLILAHLRKTNKDAQQLGEFFHPFVARYEQFTLDEHKCIVKIQQDTDQTLSEQEIILNRLSMIEQSTLDQSLSMRLFPQKYSYPFINYEDIVKKLKDQNFKFISLYRDIFSRAISWAMMEQTSIIQSYRQRHIQWQSTANGIRKKVLPEPAVIPTENFVRIILRAVQDDTDRRTLSNMVDAVEVNYNNLLNDIENIGITVNPTQIVPVYELPYDKLITNYDELLEIYHKLKTTI